MRFDLEGDTRRALAFHASMVGMERISEPAWRIELQYLAGDVLLLMARQTEREGRTNLPVRFDVVFAPVLLRHFRRRECAEHLFRRRSDVDHIDEFRPVTHHPSPNPFSVRSAPASASVRTFRSSARRSHGSA